MTQTVPAQIFGAFIEEIPPCNEYLTLNFSPHATPRKQRWRNYGLSADFLGDYFAAFFPGDAVPDSSINQRDTVKATVSFIANELLENAVKYSNDSSEFPISISLHLYDHQIIFKITNYASQTDATRYQKFIQELLNTDFDSYYMRHLEKVAMGTVESSMGILTMMNDYAARFGWKFTALPNSIGIWRVDVLVYLDV